MLAPSSSTSGDRERGEAGRCGAPLVGPSGDRERGEAGRCGSPLVGPSGDRERGEAGRCGSPLVEPSGDGMRVILPARLARPTGTRLAAMESHRFDTPVYARRLAAAADAAADAGLAGLVITPGYDLRYLVGSRAQTFERLTALVLPAAGEPTIVVPRLELASLGESAITALGL